MTNTPYFGRTAKLFGQLEDDFRTLPDTPGMQELPFSKLTIGENADLQDDSTIEDAPLMNKRTEMDTTVEASGTHVMCLNAIGWFLTALLGAPTTTGAGAPYTHVWTLGTDPRPSNLLELQYGAGASLKVRQFLGMVLNELGWPIMEGDQSFTSGWIGAVQVKPFPTAAFDSAPAGVWARNRACTKRGNIYDVVNNSTLGAIIKGALSIGNDVEGEALADGQEGYGIIMLGQPKVTGTLDAIYTAEANVYDDALSGASKILNLVSGNAAGDSSLTVTIPNVEFDRPKHTIETRKGLKAQGLAWRAHQVSGADPVTFTLINPIASY